MEKFQKGRLYSLKDGAVYPVTTNGPLGKLVTSEYIRAGEIFVYSDGRLFFNNSKELSINATNMAGKVEKYYDLETLIEWRKLRKQYAGHAMQALLPEADLSDPHNLAKMSFKIADAMIDLLKEEY